MDYPCVTPYILFYIDGPPILHCFRVTLLEFKMAVLFAPKA